MRDTRAANLGAIRHEMARKVEDVLARRTRMLFLNTAAAIESAELVACMIANELGHSEHWAKQKARAFRSPAQSQLLT
ncbi:MAG: glycerol-3-phosphate dehydrogenase C-terminal domain-containing protein [Lentimonas sp.]